MTAETARAANERAIRDVIDVLVAAIRAKDLRTLMSVYAPDLVAFDVGPPLQTSSAEAFEQQWQAVFAHFPREIDYEVRDLHITTGDDVAYSHSLNRITTLKEGRKTGVWVRWTACSSPDGGATVPAVPGPRATPTADRVTQSGQCLSCRRADPAPTSLVGHRGRQPNPAHAWPRDARANRSYQ